LLDFESELTPPIISSLSSTESESSVVVDEVEAPGFVVFDIVDLIS